MKIAVTIDVESDSAAFANKITGVQGVKVGLPKYVDFLRERGYPLTVFIACDILQYLDALLLGMDSTDIRIIQAGRHKHSLARIGRNNDGKYPVHRVGDRIEIDGASMR
jgi:hypothetical protein